jgi:periplasmic protein TonB
MEAAKILTSNYLDILFDGKNKLYGAYTLRKFYNKRLLLSIIYGLALTTVVIITAMYFEKKFNSFIELEASSHTLQSRAEIKTERPKPKEEKTNKPTTIKVNSQKSTLYVVPIPVKNPISIDAPTNPDDQNNPGLVNNPTGGIKFGPPILPPTDVEPGEGGGNSKPKDNTPITIDPKDTQKPKNWATYLQKALQPAINNASELGALPKQYPIKVKFLISETGQPIQAEAIEGTDEFDFKKEAEKAIMQGPNWSIARNEYGEAVQSIRYQVIIFSVPEE